MSAQSVSSRATGPVDSLLTVEGGADIGESSGDRVPAEDGERALVVASDEHVFIVRRDGHTVRSVETVVSSRIVAEDVGQRHFARCRIASETEKGVTGVPATAVAGTDVHVLGAQPVELYRHWIRRLQSGVLDP